MKPGATIVAAVVITAALFAFGMAPARAAEDPRERQGRALFAKGEYEAALDIYATLFAEQGDPLFLRNIGRCNQKLHRPGRAIDAFNEYLRQDRRIKAAERQEVEGFIQEMQELRTRMEASEREKVTATPADTAPPAPTPAPAAPVPSAPAPAPVTKTREPATTERLQGIPERPPETVVGRHEPRPDNRSQTGRFFLAVAVGTGFGIASGSGELNPMHRLAQEGFALAQLGHAAPEIGIFILPRLLLSAQLRLQYVTFVNGEHITGAGCFNDYCQPKKLSESGFGHLAWLFGDGFFHFFPGIVVGGGNIRHAIVFDSDRKCGPDRNTECVDTLASGPFLFGPSLGILVEMGRTLNFMLTLNTQIGVPKNTLNVDINGGFAIRL